jgi:hypothetical protein
MNELTKERQILMAMRKTLAKVVRDLTPNDRTERYPLSDETVEEVKHCFDLMAARERELAQLAGTSQEYPHFKDEPPKVQPLRFKVNPAQGNPNHD